MRIEPMEDIGKALIDLDEREWESMTPFYTLLLCPEFAEPEEIRQRLHGFLLHKLAQVRRVAATVLAKIGDPDGVLHLTYNILSRHPVLKQNQINAERDFAFCAQQALLPFAGRLTPQCVELMFSDLLSGTGKHQLDVLALAPINLVEKFAIEGLNRRGLISVYCAYILARHNRNEGLSVLIDCMNRGWHVELGVLGLSHVGDKSHTDLFNQYLQLDLPIYRRYENLFGFLHRICELRRDLLVLPPSKRLTAVLEKYLLNRVKFHNIEVQLLSVGNRNRGVLDTAGSTVDLVEEFASVEERDSLYKVQRENAAMILDRTPVENTPVRELGLYCLGLPDQKPELYYPKIKITFAKEDLLDAASDWLLHPEKFRFGQYHGPYANYDS